MKKLIKIFSTLFACSVLAFSISACTDNTATQSGNDFSSTHTHEYTATVTSPTCIEQGYTTHTCTCGDEYVDSYVNATNHNFMYYVYDNNATCLENGTETAVCVNKGCMESNTRVKANSLTSHTVDDSGRCSICNQTIVSTKGILYGVSDDGTYAEVLSFYGDDTEITIASIYNDLPVKTIYKAAFRETRIISVIIPNSVTSIGYEAFSKCDNLTTVSIGNGVTSIDNWAFSYCDNLANVIIPDSVTSIGEATFYGCNSLTNVSIPDSVTSIGTYAFSNCDKLQFNIYKNCRYLGNDYNPYLALIDTTNLYSNSYEIHENTKLIADRAFFLCPHITVIVIPDSVTSIGNSAFEGLLDLSKVFIGNGVTSIGDATFYCCINLTNIFLPDSVTFIGKYAFSDCYNLTSVIFKNPVGWSSDGYYKIPSEALGNPATAAKYLKSTYSSYTWQRTE